MYVKSVLYETYNETFMKLNETFGEVKQTLRFHKSFISCFFK